MNITYKKNFEFNIITKNYLKNDKETNYTDNFGYQWNKYRKTQIDDSELHSSKTRFFNETGFSHLASVVWKIYQINCRLFTRCFAEMSRPI